MFKVDLIIPKYKKKTQDVAEDVLEVEDKDAREMMTQEEANANQAIHMILKNRKYK